jgi:PAS domain S-box-containing protein
VKEGGIWLSAALEHVRDGVIGVDRTGAVVWMNPAAERLTGQQKTHATGRQVNAIIDSPEKDPHDSLGAWVQGVMDSAGTASETCRELTVAGSVSVQVDVNVASVFQSGECRGAVIVLSEHVPGSFSELEPASPGKALKRSAESEQARTRRVLVMDDDDVVRNLTVQKLIRLGYESEGAPNGEEAVSMFKAAREEGKPFDVIVLDLIVRGGLGGKDTLEMLMEVDPGVKAILTSGHAVDPVLTNFWEYGFFGVIRKPFVIKELDVTIRQVLEEE